MVDTEGRRGSGSADPGPLGVIAGNGNLPAELVAAVRATGRPVVLVAIRGESDPALDGLGARWVEWGQVGKLFGVLRREGVHDIVLIGGVAKRPDFKSVVSDFETLKRLPRILSTMIGGDDSVLTRVLRLVEDEGFRILGAQDVAPGLLAGIGVLGRERPGERDERDIRLCRAVITALGPYDVGQAAVAMDGRVVAIEAAEGTDAMLARVTEARAARRISAKGTVGVLVKGPKPGQDLRVDLPTIGRKTIDAVKAAGLAGIAVEAGRVLIADRAATIAAADQAGLFLIGYKVGRAD
ncbi:LpxI family protein [Segnochrobactraceae bacterium EtOH-i3]